MQKGKNIPITTVVTQVLVKEDDPDFNDPSKPVGPFYTEEEAMKLKEEKGYIVKLVKPNVKKPWRRVVPSPEPFEIVESNCVQALVDAHAIVIASGGGGIPVMKKSDGTLQGLEAVIDKDKAGNVLAKSVNADIYLILTDVEHALINYGKPDEKPLGKITVAEAERYLEEGHFLAGSMGPKVTAAIRFVKAGGEKSIITSLANARQNRNDYCKIKSEMSIDWNLWIRRKQMNKNKEQVLANTIQRCKEKNIIIPTYEQMRNPELIPEKIKEELNNIGMWDLNSLNLFRLTWKNEPRLDGGGFGKVNFIELPKSNYQKNLQVLMQESWF